MPISDEALQNERNRFLAVKGEATIGQTLAALKTLGGQTWWHIVVRMNDGSWRAARFSELLANLNSPLGGAETKLLDFSQLKTALAVERVSLETKAAQTLARKSEAHVLVVTEDGLPVGILTERVYRGVPGSVPTATLDQIGGEQVKLKDYGTILLGSSKK